MTLRQRLEIFNQHIDLLNADNVFIGGLVALQSHGLSCRAPEDLDVIIYNPTLYQINTVRKMVGLPEFEDRSQDEKEEDSEYDENDDPRRRSYKLVERGMILNFLMEYKMDAPTDCLLYHFNGRYYNISPISSTIAAKKKYSREKDLKDFEELKMNF